MQLQNGRVRKSENDIIRLEERTKAQDMRLEDLAVGDKRNAGKWGGIAGSIGGFVGGVIAGLMGGK
jgi:hypothetical protein